MQTKNASFKVLSVSVKILYKSLCEIAIFATEWLFGRKYAIFERFPQATINQYLTIYFSTFNYGPFPTNALSPCNMMYFARSETVT
jgi:hypothetical protein